MYAFCFFFTEIQLIYNVVLISYARVLSRGVEMELGHTDSCSWWFPPGGGGRALHAFCILMRTTKMFPGLPV